jgi:hypothetical protein
MAVEPCWTNRKKAKRECGVCARGSGGGGGQYSGRSFVCASRYNAKKVCVEKSSKWPNVEGSILKR